MAFAKKFEVEVTVPEGLKAGDTFNVMVEAPVLPSRMKSSLAGIALVDMTNEELKRELVNSKSVLYKAVKRNAAAELIAAATARVAAAEAEKATRVPEVPVTTAVKGTVAAVGTVTADTAQEAPKTGKGSKAAKEEGPVDAETAAEI